MLYSDRPSKMFNMSQIIVIKLPMGEVPGFCLRTTNSVILYLICAIDTKELNLASGKYP